MSEPLIDLRVCFEPIVRLRDGAAVAHELLLRPVNGGRLHEQASKAGMATASITEFALRSAGAVLDGSDHPIHVNVTPEDLVRPTFVSLLRRYVGERSLPHLVLEVTEDTELARDHLHREALIALRRLGIRFAIDDLGDGWASVDNVEFLRPEVIKIRLEHLDGPRGAAEAEALQALAAKHHADVVVEQIETEADLALVQRLGLSHGQGWYWDGRFAGPAAVRPA